jgi:hypothetical protein
MKKQNGRSFAGDEEIDLAAGNGNFFMLKSG